ncbi:hypothetical protein CHARACLAT_029839 [Characodon lateralis]|uniref:Uncharacterized protein n=1 Tax=Characodon lateralis TaxID=208331 RepID=A0ABU7DFD5_9TELE|nr:hypothetical protein [Characodon lateralis]
MSDVSPGTSRQNEQEALLSDTKNPAAEISSEMPKDPNSDQSVVSANVHREPDEVQNSGMETERENLDQAEPAKESVAVEIPENRDVAEISSQKSSDEETPDRHTKDEDQS